MKKIIAVFLSAIVMLAIAGCGSSNNNDEIFNPSDEKSIPEIEGLSDSFAFYGKNAVQEIDAFISTDTKNAKTISNFKVTIRATIELMEKEDVNCSDMGKAGNCISQLLGLEKVVEDNVVINSDAVSRIAFYRNILASTLGIGEMSDTTTSQAAAEEKTTNSSTTPPTSQNTESDTDDAATAQAPEYKIETIEEDGVTYYEVNISGPPDWSQDDWWYHSDYAEKVVSDIRDTHTGETDIDIMGYFDGATVFYWNYKKPKDLMLYDPSGGLDPVVYALN